MLKKSIKSKILSEFSELLSLDHTGCDSIFLVDPENLKKTCNLLKSHKDFNFNMLIDITGVDYSTYGDSEWKTEDATDSGFSRSVSYQDRGKANKNIYKPIKRFALVYQLLSLDLKCRISLKTFCKDDNRPMIDSIVDVWPSANWCEREAFDLFGIIFSDHPDLRRLLTDYGFIGHPFRKDFPLTGNVEMRYDPEKGRVIYEPVSIEPRTLVPRSIRDDNRYKLDDKE
ncbi:MAG: NADH-quinone oxidoreductase subunit C [Gammaproteobacteria bacterium TMED78]|nr:MAG: NADH-quinone oxidoreductase subunit C [Gammaproteobacteria bacterium TMED78]|tara:strand:- start:13115 stop:13798 length:684 start_codon:yes stop_codon:yes gene_type:complete